MIIKGYEEKLDDRDIRYINYVIDKSTMADAIESYIKDLDCTTIYPDGSRPRQTINYGYRIAISSIEYILDQLYLVLEEHPEKAQDYIDYRNNIIKKLLIYMKRILISREETQYDIILKNQGKRLEVLAELIQQKTSLQITPLMLAPVLQRLLSLKRKRLLSVKLNF